MRKLDKNGPGDALISNNNTKSSLKSTPKIESAKSSQIYS